MRKLRSAGKVFHPYRVIFGRFPAIASGAAGIAVCIFSGVFRAAATAAAIVSGQAAITSIHIAIGCDSRNATIRSAFRAGAAA